MRRFLGEETMEGESVNSHQRSGGISKIWAGLLFGLGFSISLVSIAGLALYASYRLSQKHQAGESTSTTWHKTFTPESGIAVLSHEPKRSTHNLKVLGTVGNKGKDTWDLIRVEVDLFDAKGSFVGQCEGYASGPILPGHQRYFAVDCNGSEREPTPEYASYTVEVINASYEVGGGT